jgi:non-ribosomal peptide synthetase component F
VLDVLSTGLARLPENNPPAVWSWQSHFRDLHFRPHRHPKGVVAPHRNVVRSFRATQRWFHFGPDDVWTLFHSSSAPHSRSYGQPQSMVVPSVNWTILAALKGPRWRGGPL